MSFEMLEERIQRLLKDKEIVEATLPQKRAIPEILKGENVLLIAPTGMGKTEAAVLPIFNNFLKGSYDEISILYITPLRALNRDMLSRLFDWGEALNIKIAVRHGDTTQRERARLSRTPPDMLITTPETLQIMFLGKNLRGHLKNVRWVVVDEVHELAQDDRGAQLSIALERLNKLCGREFQRIGLSATVGTPDEVGRFLVGVGRKVKIVKVTVPKRIGVEVECPDVKNGDKELSQKISSELRIASAMRRCKELVDEHNSTLFFVNTRDTAEALSARYRIWDEDICIGVHHGSLSKDVRVKMEDEFKSEKLKALICTSSLELGIDIGSADFTIQFNSPREVTRLIQRVGRSGHKIGKTSKGRIIATNPDEILESGVIADKALKGELEQLKVRENPYGVLANQIVALAMVSGRCDIKESYDIIKRAYPFRNLRIDEFRRVLEQLSSLRSIYMDEESFRKGRGAINYFYDNISMIPDEKTYKVRDISTRSVIGTLDERFVANYAREGERFIVRGITWRIVEIGENEILVESVKDLGAIPSWIGEEIPVPFEVAQAVGRARRILEESNELRLPLDDNAIRVVKEYIQNQTKEFPVPSDRLITIEQGRRQVIINATFGSKVNETLARLISAFITARFGASVGITVDPYRIIFELPEQLSGEIVRKYLLELKPESVENLLRIVLRNSSYLRFQFINTAKKFGAIEKGADFRSINITRLLETFINTPLIDEAINKVIWDKMDIENTKRVLRMIQEGRIELRITKLSPIGIAGVESRRELMSPERADRTILLALKKRLEEESVKLLCLNCKHSMTMKVKNIGEKIRCMLCDSVLVAVLPPYDRGSKELIKKTRFSKAELRELKRLRKNANLVFYNGKKAVLALVARGVGVDTAARILANLHETEEEFLRDILRAEINYARTKRFWE